MKKIFTIIIILITSLQINAIRESRPTAIDSRLRVIVYNPHDVFKFTGYYGYQASIDFAKDETIQSVSMGDSTSWQIVPSGFRMFIKPIEDDATTNMTVITNKRVYYFELYAEEAADIRDPNMVFNVKFIYPDEDISDEYTPNKSMSEPDLDEPENLNFNYQVSGSEIIEPVKIFDDGRFTYFQFRNRNAEMPTFFSVDHELKEHMINYRVMGKYIVVEKIYQKLSLRLGEEVLCVFNDGYRL